MSRIERLLAALSVLLVFLYVLLRAIHVPTFHDEAATFFHYIVAEKFMPYSAHWDANNHILNSALGYLCYKLLGPQQWWIRLPNVLAFLVYGLYVVRICAQLRDPLIRWMTLIALLKAAFPLEFFSLARGYAMSIAFLMGAVWHGAAYYRTHRLSQQIYMWCWMWLAVGASLTLLNSYLILLGIALLTVVRVGDHRPWHLTVFAALGLPMFVAAARYAFELKERGLLYTGSADGFVEVTVRSLVRYQLDMESAPMSALLTAIGAGAGMFIVFRSVKGKMKWNALTLATVLLLLNALASVLLNLLFGMNFPENRVGMYYIPLFLITVAGALDQLTLSHRVLRWSALAYLVFPAHLLRHVNLNSTILWPNWHASEGIYRKAFEMQQTGNTTLMLSADYLNELGWAYYNFLNGAPMQLLQREPVPDTLADLIIARPSDFDFATIDHDTIFHDAANDVYLLHRRKPLIWSECAELVPERTEFSGQDEFYELVNAPVEGLSATSGRWELTGTLSCTQKLTRAQLVMVSACADGQHNTYNMIPLHWIRPAWQSDTLHIKRTYHFADDARTFKLYFWNLDHDTLDFRLGTLCFSAPE